MTETTALQLFANASKQADANGIALIALGPQIQGERWSVTSLSVNSTSVLVPEARIYLGSSVQSNYKDGTKQANANTSDTTYELASGEFLTVAFTGCTPGAICSVNLDGTRTLRGKVAY